MKTNPPKLANRFLQWYCRPELLDEIQGDAYELYYREVKLSKRKADWKFIWNVLRFFKWSTIKRKKDYSSNSSDMFKSYLVTGIRNLLRHRLNGSINIVGLSLALGIAITTFIFIDNQLHADHFHENLDRIYQVTSELEVDKRTEEWSDSPMMLGPSLLKDQNAIESYTRIEFGSVDIRYQESVFNEPIWFADSAFLEIFSFPIVAGDVRALDQKNQLALEKGIAEKYFGDANPIGQSLSLKFREHGKEEFMVGAVFERPTGSTLYPSVLLSMAAFHDLRPDKTHDWAYQVDATFILLRRGYSVEELSQSMMSYINIQNAASPQWLINQYQFRPLKGLGFMSTDIISSVSQGAHPAGLISLGVIAGFLLILASLNYMNVSIATVATRLKEIGIRKVIGGQKRQIIYQFLTENFLMCSLSLGLGCLIAYLFLLPGFNSLYPVNLPFEFSSGYLPFVFFGGLLLFIGLLSGAYPAIYISSFQPIMILKGREKFGQKSLFSRVLLTFQFILAFMTIVGSFVFIDNSLYLKNKDWGYQHDNVIAVRVQEKDKYLALRDRLSGNENITNMAGADNHIGRSNTRTTFVHNEQRIETVDFQIGYNYLETMNIRLKEGRSFDRTIQSDEVESVIINETFATAMGWSEPLGQSFELDSVKRFVIGVVKDFHYEGFYNILGPVLFRITQEDDFNFLAIQVSEGHLNKTQGQVKSIWASIAPDDTYEGFIQDDVFADFNRDNNANVQLLIFITTITITLASLGLFGLVSFNTTRRMKEYSVRKVFGANMLQIFKLMNRDYVLLLVTAFAIGAPAGFFLINSLIQSVYPDPQDAGPFPFAMAVGLMALAVALTIASQLARIRRNNPTEALRND